jgi:hypothetical protein
MPKALTERQVEQFSRDGYVFPLPVLSANIAADYRARLEALAAREGGQLSRGTNQKPHLLLPWLNELIRHPRILDAVEDVLGPDLLCWGSGFFWKPAQDPAFISWHQDATYFALEPACHVTAWVALTDAPVESGCMEVVPGSHRSGQLHHGQTDSPHNLLSRGQTITAEFDRRDTVFMPVRAGQMSLHHTHLVHRSGPNRADHRRIGLGISYIPTHVRCRCRTRLSAMLVRGADRYGHFDDEPRPATDYGAAERAFHAAAVARFREANREETLQYEGAAE